MSPKTKQIIAIGLAALFVFGTVYVGCDSKPPKPDPKPPVKPVRAEIIAPDFNADSAYAFVKKQVDFGPRVPNLASHTNCGDWLEQTMQQYGAEVTAQRATVMNREGKNIEVRNIICQFQKEKAERVMLCAHWDTRPIAEKDKNTNMQNKPIDGANDGASGVGVLLEIARQLQLSPSNIGVDIILFDAEDNGMSERDVEAGVDEILNPDFETTWCLGSQYWSFNKHERNYNPRFGICLDMVGAADATFYMEGTSMNKAPDVMNLVWNTAAKLGYDTYFKKEEVAGVTDDHSYVNRGGVRCIDIIDVRPMAMGLGHYLFGPYHHTHQDNMKIIDTYTLKAVGQTVMQVIYNQ
ncbi:MAG: M28 family peptidase [Flavobacteriales bacterium]